MTKKQDIQKFKYIFVGGGVSSTYSILKMLKGGVNGRDILVIDKGRDPYSRDKRDILNNLIGGSGASSDFKAVFSLHPDLILFDYFDKEEVENYYKFIQDIIMEFHPNPETISITEPTEPHSEKFKEGWGEVAIRESLCWHVGTEMGQKINENIYNYFKEHRVNILTETSFQSIDQLNNQISTTSGNFQYEQIFFGLGKTGSKIMEKIYNQLNLEQYNNEAHIGVRFETTFNPTIQEISKTQYDFKFTKDNARTFCVCHRSSYVAEEHFNNGLVSRIQYNGEGYGLYNEEKRNDLTNFGILITVKRKHSNLVVEEIVKKLNNQGIVIEGDNVTYISSRENLPNKITKEEFISLFQYDGVEIGKEILDFVENLKPILGFGENYRLFGPEIKEMGNRVELLKDFSIKGYENIHVIGDLMGTKGIIPAGVTGIGAVKKFIKEKNEN